jgi:hypothetical protein
MRRPGRIYFTGNADTPIERHLYWVTTIDPPRRSG